MAASTTKKKAAKSGDPRVRSTAQSWKRNVGEDLTLPSGNVALVKRPGPAAILGQGLLPDELTPIVQEAIRSGKGMPPEKMQDLIGKPEGVISMLDAVDRVAAVCILEPSVKYHKREVVDSTGIPLLDVKGKETWEDIPDSDRDTEEFIYTDEIDPDDKMFIFNFAVGGTRDLTRFRKELNDGVGDLQSGEASQDQPE